jgi:quinol monooxygenase YgiN
MIKELRLPVQAVKFTNFCNMFERYDDQASTAFMIKRIVQMELLPGREGHFLDIFEEAKKEIRARAGCRGLEVLRSELDGQLSIWTISLWDNEQALDQYRSSDLFKKTWSAVKPLFSGKARAWTLTSIEEVS